MYVNRPLNNELYSNSNSSCMCEYVFTLVSVNNILFNVFYEYVKAPLQVMYGKNSMRNGVKWQK